ncbi:glutathione S-transferase family protein [Granulosicoccus antarcticus]|uniref:Dichloromethane dehalogenase n=1 Tax=Granulosicoccus antarcticus IMCC3135 TaxID=1192854 RepID=A0A2Z2NPI4_9GAMM|nr:glutathione S-transferase family protein [Granulosicoccus antarcticus]ASJ73183.1 Dichloromethane dehalogenase [Granulosicoccus antarcticus IMCC3135]
MRLYHHPMSTNARRVLMTAEHLGIKLDLVLVDLAKAEQNAPEFLKLNPNQRIPVLEDEGFVLWESYAIMQYLADITLGQTVYPVDPKARADVNRWLFWCAQDFMPGVSILNWENSIKTMIGIGPSDPEAVTRGESLLGSAAGILDEHLANCEWICESGLSLADFAISAPLADQDRACLPVKELKNLQRWLKQVQALDAWTNTDS